MAKNLSLFSFFAGSGLLDLGFEDNNFNIVFVNEFCDAFLSAYKYVREKNNYAQPKYGYSNDSIENCLTGKNNTLLKQQIKKERELEPRPGTKVLAGEIVPMTPEERREAGQLTDGEYRELKSAETQGELNRRLAELNTEEAKARAELDGGYAETRREKLVALLAVKQQLGWPASVKWPL